MTFTKIETPSLQQVTAIILVLEMIFIIQGNLIILITIPHFYRHEFQHQKIAAGDASYSTS